MIDGMYSHPRDDKGEFVEERVFSVAEQDDEKQFMRAKISEMSATITDLTARLAKMDKAMKALYESVRHLDRATGEIRVQLDGKVDLHGWRD